jgi:hypothetical protein
MKGDKIASQFLWVRSPNFVIVWKTDKFCDKKEIDFLENR